MKKSMVVLGVTMALSLTSALAAEKIKLLLITGDDVTPAHNWKEMSAATRDVLDQSGKFDVKVVEDLTPLDSKEELAKYDVLFLTRYNRKGTLNDGAKENLLNFVKDGKGLVLSHLASASFPEWTEFRKMVGRYWVMGKSGHGPRAPFKVKVVAKDSPITRDVADFEVDDELYAKLLGEGPINVLVEADSNWSKKTEPLAFTLEYGKGRVYHEAFGHDGKAIKTPAVAKLISQGCEWAAGKNQNPK